jgi:hypothetical protein
MIDPGQAAIMVRLFGEDLPLKLTRRGLRRAEYESRTPLFGAPGSDQFWRQLQIQPTPFHFVVLMFAALVHLHRFTFDEVDEAMVEEDMEKYISALLRCIQRDFPTPDPKPEEAEEAVPFPMAGITG